MNRLEAVEKVNEILGENLTQEFDAQDERAGISGNSSFLVKNSKGLAVQVELEYNEDADILNYTINEEWTS